MKLLSIKLCAMMAAVVMALMSPVRADIASVGYVHKYVTQKWDVSIPHSAANSNIVNMKYLMSVVDKANAELNGRATTDYANDSSRATSNIASVTAARDAIDKLIEKIVDPHEGEYKFFFTPATDSTEYKFQISAAGTYYINWGDGKFETITKRSTDSEEITHTYAKAANTYNISLGGKATAYSSSTTTAAISFAGTGNSSNKSGMEISKMSGCLGCIFSTLSSGSNKQPRFYKTFYYNTDTSMRGEIPENLFSGISGAPASYMFAETFHSCKVFRGSIPENLFAGIKGAPAGYMFYATFSYSGVGGSIPENLFAGIQGAPAEYMFADTFQECSGLTGSIPENLFAGINGAPAKYMFNFTFSGCSGLTGSIPENLFAGINGAPVEYMFNYTFYRCSNLTGSIPAGLFAGISGAPAGYMFQGTFFRCSGLTGSIPEDLFAGITTTGAFKSGMFASTFRSCTNLTGYSPKIGGKYLYEIWTPTSNQYTYTDDTGLEDYDCIPEVWGGGGTKAVGQCEPVDPHEGEYKFFFTPATTSTEYKFQIGAAGTYYINWGDGSYETITKTTTTSEEIKHTYADSANKYDIKLGGKATEYTSAVLSAVISFAGPGGTTKTSGMEISKMSGCLGCIFSTLSSGSNKQPRFYKTFYYNINLAGNIPEGLFSGISGVPVSNMFNDTFNYCKGLTGSIPEGLFAGISGAPAEYMFYYTFAYSGVTGSIPEGLFAGIKGEPANSMFRDTFVGCSGLTGSIPAGLFAGIKGAPEIYMFSSTFSGCSGLIGSIPENLFADISGAPAGYMFSGTFYGCSGLTGDIPEGLFAGITPTGDYQTSMFSSTFQRCTKLTGYSPKINGQYLYEIWTPTSNQYTYTDDTGLEDYDCIPTVWGGRGTKEIGQCEPTDPHEGEYKFFFTPATTSTEYKFSISAAGTYYINWGDGKFETINKTTTTAEDITHTYAKAANTYNISLGGKATAYSSTYNGAAISFAATSSTTASGMEISKMSGCLGCIFSTLSSGTNKQPRFYQTFYYNANLTSNIPEGLFEGVSGAPTTYMFESTFSGCSGLTGSIPEGLFAGMKGTPTYGIFASTFYDCSGLTGSIPAGLFSGITGAPEGNMFSRTFSGCSKLTGSIPEGLFAGISGAPVVSMFSDTFSGCSGLTGSIPAGLFAGIKGAPAIAMFSLTFYGCSGLTGSIPVELFAGIKGAPAIAMFQSTFNGCSKLTGSIPEDLFAGITPTGDYEKSMFYGTFWDCTNLTGYSPKINGKYLYEIWTPDSQQYTFNRDPKLDDYDCIPAVWGGRGTKEIGQCEPTDPHEGDYQFFFTPATDGTEYKFAISAAGTYYINWGDGSYETITKPTPSWDAITHTYADAANKYNISLGGKATAYLVVGNYIGAIEFADVEDDVESAKMQISKMSGCLGCIFSTIGDGGEGKQPKFSSTFFGNRKLTGSIPAGLFVGISGAPLDGMFYSTFNGCGGLTGSIPENLFADITPTGDYQTRMFNYTFVGCSGLTGYSPKIDGKYLYEIWTPDSQQYTFSSDTKLDDYACIPKVWGGGGTKEIGQCGENSD